MVLSAGALCGAAPSEAAFEKQYLAVPSSAGAAQTSRFLGSVYHYPGTPGDYQVARFVRDQMRSFGLDARIESLTATVYTPKTLQLVALTKPAVEFDLRDPAIAADPTALHDGIGLPFNAGSGNGDVTAALIDAGKGLDADYARLRGAGLNVRGKLVLVRYGAEYRGNLAARAQAQGASGVIFFTDPSQNKGPAYPNGPYASDFTIQRGDVMGDDQRPLRIPTLPISARNARRLLGLMHDGQTTVLVRLHVIMNASQKTLWNSIGEVPGSDPSESIVLGGHRDAWETGVTDDGSGIATLLEVARGLGKIRRAGWTPKRTIVVAGWDAEEVGSLGAGAYVNAHRSALRDGLIAYINTDESASGPIFGAAAAGALYDALPAPIQSILGIDKPEIDSPAGGSDFDSFIYTIGSPIIDIGYTGPFGTYHSPYDDFQFASRFGDPGFVRHRTIAQVIGIVAMHLSQADRPLSFAPYAKALDDGLDAVVRDAKAKGMPVSTTALGDAITSVESAAKTADASTAPQDVKKDLAIAQQLDLLAYSANGYASVAFPKIAAAIATGNTGAAQGSIDDTAKELRSIASSLGAGNSVNP